MAWPIVLEPPSWRRCEARQRVQRRMLMTELLQALLQPDLAPHVCDLDGWRVAHSACSGPPFERAVRGGLSADRVGFAFASGYQAACRALVPDAPSGWLLAVCATEPGGSHPRSIVTELREGRLTGEKTFVSMGTAARGLLVVASTGQHADGRNRLRLALVDAESDGVTLTAMPALPFIPEIPHATLTLQQAPVRWVCPGDGYTDALKPFRTIEDIHVNAALLSHLIAAGRRSGWAPECIESLLALVCALAPLASADPSHPAVHRALGGIDAQISAVIAGLDFSTADPQTQQRWARDAPLLRIASRARAARLAAAR